VAERLAAALGQPVVVENRPGAGGIVAMDALVHSAPDGYTLSVATMSQAIFNSYLFAKLPYDPQRDLQPVALLVKSAFVIAVHPSFPAHSMQELIAIAKAQPGKLFMGMAQLGAPPHVVALLLNRAAGIDLAMVPYKSSANAMVAALGGEVPLLFDGANNVSPHVKAGRLRALVVTGRERAIELPDVPTVAEIGIAGVDGEPWIGIVAPSGTPMAIVNRLNRELGTILDSPDMKKTMATIGSTTITASPDEFGKMIREGHVKWGPVIRDAGLTAE
jgi:tripartite-type tricarboxylate transporter receptor subunit TctC